ncbi:signal transduction histidine kinase/ActR/RegA family two-component response regulator [Sphingobium sp. OAS761]|uniref:CHASE3 domain-containing protein n=1 Tax=Sphingobium sp. OAS761 TaxID=2817901 RepID=UPI00209FA3BF|nr:CHASE3 domain-containing protein [Sphingobium sp. OAS761]MCP1470000.1 signal transduction histidine kinase/ActR/RegA family two-component response regulator [Sphingobium sp. OAS761]
MPVIRPERSVALLLLAMTMVMIAVGSTYWLYQGQQTRIAWVNHTLRVESRLSALAARIQAAESSQRGFMLTGQSGFLQSYRDVSRTWPRDVDALRDDVSDNPEQAAAVETLRGMIAQRMEMLEAVLDSRRAGVAPTAATFAPGLVKMARVRAQVDDMKAREEQLLRVRSLAAGRSSALVSLGLALSAALIIILTLISLRTAYRRIRETEENRQALELANDRLIAEAQEREVAQAQLRQVQKMESIGQLTGGIAHDFNNMLAIVIGSLDIARRRMGADVDPRVIRSIDNATEGAQRAAQLTTRLLAFSRQQPLDPQPTDVNKLVGGMSELLRRTIGEDVRVESVLAGGLWRASIDANQLENALINLCVNARDAMPMGGHLTIETANGHLDDAYAATHSEVAAGQYVMVSVTDTGTGMPADVVERAFEPFFTTKGVGKGTGLGLSQVFGFVKQSHGHVKIYSEPGEGTTIKIYLPRHYGEEVHAAFQAPHPGSLPRAKDDEIILLVEDEEQVRHMSVDSLRELGYTVVQASDGEQALEMLAIQPRIDLLFTDIVMPGINGRILADRARETREDLKVLYTTGYTRNAIVHNGMLDPGVAFLPKPFTLEQLAHKVRQVLDQPTRN